MMVGRSCKINTCPFYVIQNTQRKRKIGSSKITTHIKLKSQLMWMSTLILLLHDKVQERVFFPISFLYFLPS